MKKLKTAGIIAICVALVIGFAYVYINYVSEYIEQDQVMVIITFVYVLATIAICIFNKRSADAAREQIKQSQMALQKSIDIQLYDKMIEVSNNIENDDYSNTKVEVSILFGMDIWRQIEDIKKLIKQKSYWQKKSKRYYELCKEQGYNKYLSEAASRFDAPDDIVEAAAAQDEKFAEVEDYTSWIPEINEGPDIYNWNEIKDALDTLEKEIPLKQRELKENVYKILKSKISVDDSQQ